MGRIWEERLQVNGDPRAVPPPCGQSWTRGAEAGAHTYPGSPAQLHMRRVKALGALRLLGTGRCAEEMCGHLFSPSQKEMGETTHGGREVAERRGPS